MPELPEVETIVRGLTARLPGRRILGVDVFKPFVVKLRPQVFAASLQGRSIQRIARHGKSIFWVLDGDRNLKIHLGMTGAILFHPKNQPVDPYVRLRFHLDDPAFDVVYRDVRQFGRLTLVKEAFEKGWGPDAWLASEEELLHRLSAKRGMVKHALLNQNVLAGVGNIYADESLYEAKIHPQQLLERLSRHRLADLIRQVRAVLARSIDLGGTTFRDYVNFEGRRGRFADRLRVYGRAGKPCPRCGGAIKKTVVASRGTHFCPSCQPRPRSRRARA